MLSKLPTPNSQLTIAIVGARGKMGSAFSQLFRKHKLNVLEVEFDTPEPTTVVSQADIVLFSVPISSTTEVIASLVPSMKPGALVCDLTSIKIPAVNAMKDNSPDDSEILGLHPMFGPHAVGDMTSQVIAACPERSGPLSRLLIQLFKSEGAVIKETTPEEHDRMMSIIQGLTHLSSIATAMALRQLGFQFKNSLEFSSPIYRLRLEMIGRILSQDAQLYADIAIENPLTQDSLRAYQNAIEQLANLLNKHDTAGFVQEFQEAANYLGSFKDDAYQRTNELIQRCKDIL